jgi:hypothetical protein
MRNYERPVMDFKIAGVITLNTTIERKPTTQPPKDQVLSRVAQIREIFQFAIQ